METIKKILEFEIFSYDDYVIKVKRIIVVLFILLLTKIILWIIKKTLYRRFQLGMVDEGNTFALFQIVKYVVWVTAIAFLLESLGVKRVF